MKKFTAFTLSEIMITVGIIGVISALTVPTLVKNYQKEAQTVQLRKVVAEIESAIDMLITEEGKSSLAGTSISQDGGVDAFIRTHFKTVKTCSSSKTSDCFANENYISIDGKENKSFSCAGNSYILANSAVICANKISQVKVNAVQTQPDGSVKELPNAFISARGINIEVFIDTNGAQGPNIGGRDMFHVYIQPDGRIYDEANTDGIICGPAINNNPGGLPAFGNPGNSMVCYANVEKQSKDCGQDAFGSGCFAKLLDNNWEMNY